MQCLGCEADFTSRYVGKRPMCPKCRARTHEPCGQHGATVNFREKVLCLIGSALWDGDHLGSLVKQQTLTPSACVQAPPAQSDNNAATSSQQQGLDPQWSDLYSPPSLKVFDFRSRHEFRSDASESNLLCQCCRIKDGIIEYDDELVCKDCHILLSDGSESPVLG